MTESSLVSAVRTSPENVLEDYGKAMRQADYQEHLPKDRTTIIKLNLSWSLYYPACSTEPWQLEGVLQTLREDGYEDVVAMENKTVVTDPLKGVEQNKWGRVLDKYQVDFVPLTEVQWIPYQPESDTPGIEKTFPDGHRIPEPFLNTNVLHLPTIKTHGHTTMTGAMKNAFGGLITERRHQAHKYIHEVLVDLLKIQKEIHTGIFAVMDGTVCGDGRGPRTMEPVIKDIILASGDQVAIDSVSAGLMGFDPLEIPKLKMADGLGLGNADPSHIKVLGADISDEDWEFDQGQSLVIWADKLFRKGALSFLEPFLFHTPLFKLPILGSAVYHDYFWYPLIGRKKINQFMTTKWGNLLKTYDRK
ncbi:MAG: DUF362 domain-containing protein [Candidatus Acetothermia bacterium]